MQPSFHMEASQHHIHNDHLHVSVVKDCQALLLQLTVVQMLQYDQYMSRWLPVIHR